MKNNITSIVLSTEDKAYIDYAAFLSGMNRSEFIRASSVSSAILDIRKRDKMVDFAEYLRGITDGDEKDGAV